MRRNNSSSAEPVDVVDELYDLAETDEAAYVELVSELIEAIHGSSDIAIQHSRGKMSRRLDSMQRQIAGAREELAGRGGWF